MAVKGYTVDFTDPKTKILYRGAFVVVVGFTAEPRQSSANVRVAAFADEAHHDDASREPIWETNVEFRGVAYDQVGDAVDVIASDAYNTAVKSALSFLAGATPVAAK